MEFTKIEISAIQDSTTLVENDKLVELTLAQLVVVGGGVGEVGLN